MECFMSEKNKKYQIDTPENRKYLADMSEALLSFSGGKRLLSGR